MKFIKDILACAIFFIGLVFIVIACLNFFTDMFGYTGGILATGVFGFMYKCAKAMLDVV